MHAPSSLSSPSRVRVLFLQSEPLRILLCALQGSLLLLLLLLYVRTPRRSPPGLLLRIKLTPRPSHAQLTVHRYAHRRASASWADGARTRTHAVCHGECSRPGAWQRAWPWGRRRQRGRSGFEFGLAAPMTTGVLALKTMNVSTLQYCSVLMFVNIHARKATDTQKKLWCSAGTHE